MGNGIIPQVRKAKQRYLRCIFNLWDKCLEEKALMKYSMVLLSEINQATEGTEALF